ncbi:hypothetical protein [Nocardia sp. NPDC056000]|uniref:hypothetical protein n=1 Tax=Nocardia sp. NPDC056000 TaxID=3345674 RepID=UPI0035DAD55F
MGFDEQFDELQQASRRTSNQREQLAQARFNLGIKYGQAVADEIASAAASAVRKLLDANVAPRQVVTFDPTPFHFKFGEIEVQDNPYRMSRIVGYAWPVDGLALSTAGTFFAPQAGTPANVKLVSGRGEIVTNAGKRHKRRRDRLDRRLRLVGYPVFVEDRRASEVESQTGMDSLIALEEVDGVGSGDRARVNQILSRLSERGFGKSWFGIMPDGRAAYVQITHDWDDGRSARAKRLDSWLAGVVHRLIESTHA